MLPIHSEVGRMLLAGFAFLPDLQEAVRELIHGILLVAGGYLVGHLLGGLIAWALGRYIFRQQEPTLLHQACRITGGMTLALIVALIVLTGRGKPHGEGGDGRGSDNPDPAAGATAATPAETNPQPTPAPLPSPPKVTPGDVTIRVTILGGPDVIQDRYYLVDDDPNPKTFAELKSVITERKNKELGKVMVAILFPPRNALPRESLAVTQVSKWVNEEAKLDVIFPTGR